MKQTVIAIIAVVGLSIIAIGLEMAGLEWASFFKPKWENVERKTFEETQSYVHGKTQDLAKYFEEYQKNPEDQESIRQLILMNFADFDANDMRNDSLRKFLIEMRGY